MAMIFVLKSNPNRSSIRCLRFLLLLSVLGVAVSIANASDVTNKAPDALKASSDIPACHGKLVLVTGATGRVGRMVTTKLYERGHCVRIFTRSATKARETLGHLIDTNNEATINTVVEIAVGELGDGTSVDKAFASRETSGNAAVSHVVFAAGGEEADFDAVNNRGVRECAVRAAEAGTTSMVVISAAWVSKPYSLASLLFNALHDNFPMAKHLQGEDSLRQEAVQQSSYNDGKETTTNEGLNYVILRAGRLRPDEEYPPDAARGLLYQQGDSFSFFGPAGNPGMDNTQLALAVLSAMTVKGQYTVEVTGGTVDPHDVSIYSQFVEDDFVQVSYDDIVLCHTKALYHLKVGIAGLVMVMMMFLFSSTSKTGKLQMLLQLIAGLAFFIGYWTVFQSDISVLDMVESNQQSGFVQENDL